MTMTNRNNLLIAAACLLIILPETANAFVLPNSRTALVAISPQLQQALNNVGIISSSTSLSQLPGGLLEDDDEGPHRRKRDILKNQIGRPAALSNVWRQSNNRRSSVVVLQAKKDENNDENDSNNKSNTKLVELWESYNERLDFFLEQFQKAVQQLLLKCNVSPEFVENLPEWFSTQKDRVTVAFLSFIAGAAITVAAILVPIYNEVENLAEPVTLFETILSDLDRGYVDEVDTNKLFQTGVSAMLRSLDPYTEFEGKQEAIEMTEGLEGQYGGVGLVISGATTKSKKTATPKVDETAIPVAASQQQQIENPDSLDIMKSDDMKSSMGNDGVDELDDYDDDVGDDGETTEEERSFRKKMNKVARDRGIRVVQAFEGYSFDYGMRVGDKLVAIDDKEVTKDFTVEDVRNGLRGAPGSLVTISFTRDGVDGVQSVTMPRTIVQLKDVKLATLLGDPKDGMGYIQLSGFAANTGAEMRRAILSLQQAALEASQGERTLQGLVLDLRGNPGGLLTSAVDVSSLLVPKGSDIVSARGRGFPGVLYRSRVDPIIDYSKTKLAVLVNDRTASAAEIVSGAIQDLDVGVVVGTDRTFGKGLVQNVEELPFNTALKYTVAKYYTPSGRCIQGIQYKEGGGLGAKDSRYIEKRVAEKDKGVFYTRLGRPVKDGGGVEADYKVEAPKASALEVTLLRSNLIEDFAAEWSQKHQVTNNFEVDDDTYRDFQKFVSIKQQKGDIKLEALYNGPINDLKKILKASNYKGSEQELDRLKQSIVREVTKDFDIYKKDIKEDIAQLILARYVPESMLIQRSIKTDVQVQGAVKLLSNGNKFNKLLAKGNSEERLTDSGMSIANSDTATKTKESAKLNIKW